MNSCCQRRREETEVLLPPAKRGHRRAGSMHRSRGERAHPRKASRAAHTGRHRAASHGATTLEPDAGAGGLPGPGSFQPRAKVDGGGGSSSQVGPRSEGTAPSGVGRDRASPVGRHEGRRLQRASDRRGCSPKARRAAGAIAPEHPMDGRGSALASASRRDVTSRRHRTGRPDGGPGRARRLGRSPIVSSVAYGVARCPNRTFFASSSGPVPVTMSRITEKPFCTAGRSFIVSYQRRRCGKSSSFWPWRS